MTLFLNIAMVVASLFMLWKGSDWMVDSAVALSSRMGISQLVIGLTVVALGTSAPEFAVTVGAAVTGQLDISVSNVIGSNIFNLGFILGGVAMFTTIQVPAKLVKRDGVILIATSLAIALFLYNLTFHRLDGLLLFSGLILYLIVLFREKREVDLDIEYQHTLGMDIFLLILGLGLILAGATLLREGAVGIARAAGLSEWLIGATIVAAGTSAPEFAASLVAGIKGHHGVSVGNLIGSCIFNSLGVLGLAGVIRPMMVSPLARQSTIMLFILVVITVIMLRTGHKMTRLEGLILFLFSLAIYWVQFL